jgi:hypothetical protein
MHNGRKLRRLSITFYFLHLKKILLFVINVLFWKKYILSSKPIRFARIQKGLSVKFLQPQGPSPRILTLSLFMNIHKVGVGSKYPREIFEENFDFIYFPKKYIDSETFWHL